VEISTCHKLALKVVQEPIRHFAGHALGARSFQNRTTAAWSVSNERPLRAMASRAVSNSTYGAKKSTVWLWPGARSTRTGAPRGAVRNRRGLGDSSPGDRARARPIRVPHGHGDQNVRAREQRPPARPDSSKAGEDGVIEAELQRIRPAQFQPQNTRSRLLGPVAQFEAGREHNGLGADRTDRCINRFDQSAARQVWMTRR
jgi:hypothetical protein